jgi:hypothetical protein
MKQFDAQDAISVSDSTVTPEGFLVVPGRLARTGVQDYAAYELKVSRSRLTIQTNP